MKLKDLKNLLSANREKQLRIRLPNGSDVPEAFHITEAGHVNKRFIDCGGTVRSVQTCQLQTWLGEDVQHRLTAGKLADILRLASAVLPHDDLEVEIEHEDGVLSQYPVTDCHVSSAGLQLLLTSKHTDCLAKDKCEAPQGKTQASCCGPNCC